MTRHPPTIVAHRGLNMEFPENSLAAMRAAWDAGFEWCECDVHLSSDGVPVVIHDETLDRTTMRTGRVADFPASKLYQIHLLDRFGKPTPHLLPLLDTLLEETRVGRRLLVETKPLLLDKIGPIAEKIARRNCVLQSFHVEDLKIALRATQSRVKCAVLSETAQEFPALLINRFYLNHTALTPEICRELSRRGEVGAWTVNEEEDIRRIEALGCVNTIITDFPEDVRRVTWVERSL